MKPEKAERYQIEILKQMDGNQKLGISFQLYEITRDLMRQSIELENQGIPRHEIEKLLAERMLKG